MTGLDTEVLSYSYRVSVVTSLVCTVERFLPHPTFVKCDTQIDFLTHLNLSLIKVDIKVDRHLSLTSQ